MNTYYVVYDKMLKDCTLLKTILSFHKLNIFL